MKKRMLARRRQAARKVVFFVLLMAALSLDAAVLTLLFRQSSAPAARSQVTVDPLPALCFQLW